MGISAYIRKKYVRDDLPKGFHSLKCVYIHIPKAGGTSICLDLFGYQVGHKTYQEHARYYQKFLNEYFVFSVVRNPFSRLYSAYNFLSRGGINAKDKHFFDTELQGLGGFESFVNHWATEESINQWIHFVPQYKFLIDKNKTMKVDYVGKLEDIAKDYSIITDRLGIKERDLKIKNKTGDLYDYRSVYTGEMIDRVTRLYAKDLEVFGYKF